MTETIGCDVLFYLPTFSGGGAERVFTRLANIYVKENLKVTMLVNRAGGPIQDLVSKDVSIVEVGFDQSLRAIPRLIEHLKNERPRLVVSALTSANLAMILAVRAARFLGVDTRIMACERNEYSTASQRFTWKKRFAFGVLLRLVYPLADKVSGNASGVIDDLKALIVAPKSKFCLIPNPAPDEAQISQARASEMPHKWYSESGPVAVAMGRLLAQKDYPTMLNALARSSHDLRLIVLGVGPDLDALRQLAVDLGIQERVDFVGFQMNRFDYLK